MTTCDIMNALDILSNPEWISVLIAIFSASISLLCIVWRVIRPPIQATLSNNNGHSTIVIRNVSTETIFVDKMSIYKSFKNEIIILDLFDATLSIKPGKTISFEYTEKELESFVDDFFQRCKVSNHIKNNTSHRIGVAISIDTSKGSFITDWFKIGNYADKTTEKQHCFHAMIGPIKHYYSFRRRPRKHIDYHFNIPFLIAILSPLYLSLICQWTEHGYIELYSLAAYILSSEIVCFLWCKEGLDNTLNVCILTILYHVPLYVLFVLCDTLTVLFLLSPFFLIVQYILIAKWSGWDL